MRDADKVRPRAQPIRVADINLDGTGDICYRGSVGIQCSLASNAEHSLLKGITTAYKNHTQIEYGFTTDSKVYADDPTIITGLINVTPNRRVVTQVRTSDGVGGLKGISYTYQGLKYSTIDNEMRAFRFIREKDETTGYVKTIEFLQDKVLNGRVAKVTSTLNNIALQTVTNSYNVINGKAPKSRVISPKQTIETRVDYDTRQTLSTQTTTYNNYTAYGDPQSVSVLIQTPDNSDWNRKTTTTTYWNDEGQWLLGKPSVVSVTHQNPLGSLVRKTSFTYDANGVLQQEVIQPGDALALTSTFVYDGFGNKTQTTISGTGVNPRTSHVAYDTTGLYPIKQTNALGHTEAFTYDSLCGVPLTQTGPNGLKTQWQYDNLCQKIKEIRADGTSTVWTRAWSQGYSAGYGIRDNSIYTVTEASSGSATKTVWYDSLSREVRSAVQGFDSKAATILQDKIYDTRGLLIQATLPYDEGHFPGDNSYWVTSKYDTLGRTVEQSKPTAKGTPIVTRYSSAQQSQILATIAL
ncbi:MAG: hypothetical protein WAQ53_06215 [Thiofilum sp.]|uniref:hypothetical protein n=1 Tax=Thiofilum sp. TaxID=2212733 RepID=UPI0025E15468|nr:hypothetical protein [Thiofilum sp.]MBK8455199.1 hypothetical protein [Thiofilum sp.]